MKVGIFGTSLKKNEYRIPIHPKHLLELHDDILERMYIEEGYADMFGFEISTISSKLGGVLTRKELFQSCDVLILPKMCQLDYSQFREGQVIYGWPHCVQGREITKVAIDKKLTMVAFEAMFSGNGDYKHHIFHKNNEIAGFAAVQHATQIRGISGYYNGTLKAIVFGFGSTSRGVVHALQSQGVSDITVFTRRESHLVQQQIPGIKYEQFQTINGKAYDLNGVCIAERLSSVDIIANCILQNPNSPVTFVEEKDYFNLKPNSIIIDVSCDENMGFYFAKPTDFDEPGFYVGENKIYYYAVDHTPSLFWDSSSYQLSLALLPYFRDIFDSKLGYKSSDVLSKAVEIEEGNVLNDAITKFQRL